MVLTLPIRVGVFWAWGAGLVLDVTTRTVLGQHALSLSYGIAGKTGTVQVGT